MTTTPRTRRYVPGAPSPRSVRLAAVTADNWRDVAALELEPEQRDLVAGNLYSIAESKFDPLARPRAIYAGSELVGFLMYDVGDEDPRRAVIYRFMIDRRFQGLGYGRVALEQAIEEIRAVPGVVTIAICYEPNNPAKQLYLGVGFVEIGSDEDGEVIAELAVQASA
ncbi:GNAT family N-acetyltransferase [Rhodoplanes sp. TEM]|uniref:GNAT family N-acetyltransferase n=1 Tax=Rhodoplanes tepidamans TaxID=200616 RepID=A0ABT5J625_RHOTP|nr:MULTISPECIES: GNAT family N-acetyltransferase [Rhodoplanes]MDC7784836.1 GNAT family N-acetyltransferase [Rhodoplanes tepidamans]MDC7982303.1 GNAT family N-acetyltransferase [Rhodoplanes sp. TEM]MDQ0356312.1 diamine N-acetyltransferase [Rhodoplanes tepidamans]